MNWYRETDAYDTGMGATFDGHPAVSTYALVRQYLLGFGTDGVRTQDIVNATGRDRKRVRQVLDRLHGEGFVCKLTEPNPRRGGSRRLRWRLAGHAARINHINDLPLTERATAFTGTEDEHVI